MKIPEFQLQKFNKSIEKKAATPDLKKEDAKLRQSAKDMEAIFLNIMIKAMESTIPENQTTENSMAKMMFSNVMSQALAQGGGIGLADFIYHSLQQSDLAAISKIKNEFNPVSIPFNNRIYKESE
jgi:Rod binding domain-containing protein